MRVFTHSLCDVSMCRILGFAIGFCSENPADLGWKSGQVLAPQSGLLVVTEAFGVVICHSKRAPPNIAWVHTRNEAETEEKSTRTRCDSDETVLAKLVCRK